MKIQVQNLDTSEWHFQFEGDVTETNHILYDCVMSRPNLASKTTEESKEIQTETAKIKAIPLDSGYVKAYTNRRLTLQLRFKLVYYTSVTND